jgi:hypothetical protein
MITFTGTVQEKKDGRILFDMMKVDDTGATANEKAFFHVNLTSISDGEIDVQGNYMLRFKE